MHATEEPYPLVRSYREAPWGWIAGAWGAIYVFEASRHCVDAFLGHRSPSISWLLVVGGSMALWAFFTPFMLWVGRRAPFDRGDRRRTIATHVVAYLGITLVDAAVQTWVFARLSGASSTFVTTFLATMLIDGLSYATVIAIGHAARMNGLYRERVQAQAGLDQELTRARLRALEMQLQPHFLFNTLHAVGSLVRGDRHDDAIRSLATLGGLLRATLADGDQHELALADEAELARGYLELQQIRFADRLEVELDIAPEVLRVRVPRLILQPLLENAIRHGVEKSRTAVRLEVRARAVADRLELIVRDRGGTREAPSPGQGIGLRNTRARLVALYGDAHRIELSPTDGGGLEVRIELPLVFAPPAVIARVEVELATGAAS